MWGLEVLNLNFAANSIEELISLHRSLASLHFYYYNLALDEIG